jgi:hypothetical protein
MTELHDFERRMREDLVRTAQLLRPPPGAVERAIDAARAQVEPEHVREPRLWHRLLPLAAAAAVLVIAFGLALVVNVSQGSRPAESGPGPLPSVSTPSTSVSPTPASSATASATSGTSAPPPRALTRRVTLGTATLSIPQDWVARRSTTSGDWPTWCLGPSTTQPTPTNCPVMFREVPDSWTGQALDPTIEGGLSSNPQYCGTGSQPRRPGLREYGDRSFGGRPADYRRWQYDCANGTIYRIEQYVVATGPGYILFSEDAQSQVHDAMTAIAKTASVPAQSTPVRYADTGIVRSVTHETDGYHITLDRVVTSGGPKPINNSPATYPYVIPDAIASQFKPAVAVGNLVFIATDGYHVKQAYPY